MSGQQHELESPPSDIISSLAFDGSGNKLVVGSWDNNVYVYQRTESPLPYTLHKKIACEAPVLDVCFCESEDVVAYVGLDHGVRSIKLSANETRGLSIHDEASNKVAYSPEHGIILSTSWDGTLHVHDSSTRDFIRVKLAAKPFALSLTSERVIIAMAERKLAVYDLNALKALISQSGGTGPNQVLLEPKPWQERESSLKFMTRATTCMPDGTGFVTSSIEGRVGVEWFDSVADQNKYAFRCHRQEQKTVDEDGNEEEVELVYPVNALAFHPRYGTFATGGGDGVVALWDAGTKRRVKQYPTLGAGVAAMAFSPDGRFLVVGVSPGFEDGKESDEVDPSLVKIVVRELAEGEAKPKPKEKAAKK